ncbi:hypothetical protein B7P43_G06680 [Cryptotermes secundus]|uniref:Mos1 transposase HTH domain-containing protein n=1 Tax=Cryptotermes secundus TaxID=105785 RepID=A0A2J7Q3F7_9NEOP|nr:hypothetical protein B7P43_G06680 [Cryptotermes secundus]
MATFSLQEQRVIIRFLHLRGATPIEIHRQLSETCGDGVKNVKYMRSRVRQFKEGRTSCDNEPKQSRPRPSRSGNMVERVEKVVLEDRQFLCENNLEVVSHAPYSPDLAPSDFWLFPKMKDTLRGRTFTSPTAIASAIFQWSKQTPTEAFAAAMESWR